RTPTPGERGHPAYGAHAGQNGTRDRRAGYRRNHVFAQEGGTIAVVHWCFRPALRLHTGRPRPQPTTSIDHGTGIPTRTQARHPDPHLHCERITPLHTTSDRL